MTTSLSFEQAPHVSVPYRFLLAAPGFGVAAGLLLVWAGDAALASRWTPQALALVHLLALGFMLQAMCGALFQFIPVAVGGNVWRPRWVAHAVQPLLLLATLLLAAGWLGGQPALVAAAVPPALLAVGSFAAVVTWALWRTPATGMTLWTLRLAIVGLVVTAVLGGLLAEALARGLTVPVLALTDVHLAWGLGGWSLMLLAGVSYHVVPMFQLTRPYPRWFARGFGPLLLLLLLGWSARPFLDDPWWAPLLPPALLALLAAYAAVTLWLQQTRRRKVHDATSLYFRVAMLSLLAFCALAAALLVQPGLAADPRAVVGLGVLALVGVFISAISGMMYKILPFLNWLHLQGLGVPMAAVPNMKQMIPAPAMNGQFRAHLLALALLLAAVWLPVLARPAGLMLAASCSWLGWNLVGAARRYREFSTRLTAAAAA